MADDSTPSAVTVVESETAPAPSTEYDFGMTASATVDGSQGRLRVRRRYHARPRHNDVVEWTGADSNDELLDRADELYAHTRYYRVTDAGAEYVRDRHETWRPSNLAALASEAGFDAACEAHHLDSLPAEYEWVMGERRRGHP